MELYGDDEHDLKELFDRMKKEFGGGNEEVNLHSFRQVLRRMGKYDFAEKIYHRLLAELPPNDHSLDNLYNWIGNVYRRKRELEKALENYNTAIELFRNANDEDHSDMAGPHNNIGLVCFNLNKYDLTMEHYQQSFSSQHPEVRKVKADIQRVSVYLK